MNQRINSMKLNIQFYRRASGALLALGLLAATGCGRSTNSNGPAGLPGSNMPPTEVGVVTIAPDQAVLTVQLPGRVNAMRVAEVRARVTGILQKRLFEEGADVAAGQVLFEIDPAPLQATYDSAKASLAKAQASREQSQAKARRYETLVQSNAVSRQTYEDAKAGALQDEADVLAAKASLDKAALDLGYAKVTAPISGRIGKALVTEGALASSSEATKMAVIYQLDPIYVDSTQTSTELLKVRRSMVSGARPDVSRNELKIALLLEDGTTYAETGRPLFQDVSVDENTGSVLLRAEFPNPEKFLLPGMYVRTRLEVVQPEALTVPQRAVSRDASGQASVWVVNAQNVVEQRGLQTSSISGDKWIVSSGLNAGDRVIVEGLQRVRAGAPVTAVPFQTGNTNTPMKSSAATANP